jgi:hypothetical protein
LVLPHRDTVPEAVTAEGKRASCYLIVLEKTSGKLSCVPNIEPQERLSSYAKRSMFQWDASGSLIVFDGQRIERNDRPWEAPKTDSGYPGVYMLDFRTPSLVLRTIFERNGYAERYAINGAGDILMQFYEHDGESGRKVRVVKPEGGFQPLGEGEYMACLTSGAPGDADSFYYIEGIAGANYRLVKIAKDAGEYKSTVVFEDPTIYGGGAPGVLGYFRCSDTTIAPDGSMLFLGVGDRDPYDKSVIAIRYKAGDAAPTRMTVPALVKIVAGTSGTNKVYLLGENTTGSSMIISLSPSAWTFTTVVDKNLYQIASIKALGSQLFFQGEKQANGAFINGALDASDALTEATVGLQKVTALIPIR